MWRRPLIGLLALVLLVTQVADTLVVALSLASFGSAPPGARGTGHDAQWLGHAWVDGRKDQSDVDSLVTGLRGTGIRDLFVHTGPFNDDGTLDPALRPRARWFVDSIHAALPGVRVQAWLGAYPRPDQLHRGRRPRGSGCCRRSVRCSAEGFDGIHYDFEPIADGNQDLLAMLAETGPLTRDRRAVLSVSAIHHEPWPGVAACLGALPAALSTVVGRLSAPGGVTGGPGGGDGVRHRAPSRASYVGYVRRATGIALRRLGPPPTWSGHCPGRL